MFEFDKKIEFVLDGLEVQMLGSLKCLSESSGPSK